MSTQSLASSGDMPSTMGFCGADTAASDRTVESGYTGPRGSCTRKSETPSVSVMGPALRLQSLRFPVVTPSLSTARSGLDSTQRVQPLGLSVGQNVHVAGGPVEVSADAGTFCEAHPLNNGTKRTASMIRRTVLLLVKRHKSCRFVGNGRRILSMRCKVPPWLFAQTATDSKLRDVDCVRTFTYSMPGNIQTFRD